MMNSASTCCDKQVLSFEDAADGSPPCSTPGFCGWPSSVVIPRTTGCQVRIGKLVGAEGHSDSVWPVGPGRSTISRVSISLSSARAEFSLVHSLELSSYPAPPHLTPILHPTG